ncbi:MAG: YceI family protein [Myxococcales bacterium]
MEAVLDAVIRVYTFKDGLLSKLAHDLSLNLLRFEIALEGDEVRGVFEASSLEVMGAVRDGAVVPGSLSAGDKAKIQASMRDDILKTARYPQVRWSGRASRHGAEVRLDGTLELCGVAKPCQLVLRATAGRLAGELELSPSLFGIKPFRALGGALKIQDRVRIGVDAADPGAQRGSDPVRWRAVGTT